MRERLHRWKRGVEAVQHMGYGIQMSWVSFKLIISGM